MPQSRACWQASLPGPLAGTQESPLQTRWLWQSPSAAHAFVPAPLTVMQALFWQIVCEPQGIVAEHSFGPAPLAATHWFCALQARWFGVPQSRACWQASVPAPAAGTQELPWHTRCVWQSLFVAQVFGPLPVTVTQDLFWQARWLPQFFVQLEAEEPGLLLKELEPLLGMLGLLLDALELLGLGAEVGVDVGGFPPGPPAGPPAGPPVGSLPPGPPPGPPVGPPGLPPGPPPGPLLPPLAPQYWLKSKPQAMAIAPQEILQMAGCAFSLQYVPGTPAAFGLTVTCCPFGQLYFTESQQL